MGQQTSRRGVQYTHTVGQRRSYFFSFYHKLNFWLRCAPSALFGCGGPRRSLPCCKGPAFSSKIVKEECGPPSP